MIERLALPATEAPPVSLEEWTAALAGLGAPATTSRDGSDAFWIEVPSHRLRGFALKEAEHLEAIHFELHAPDPAEALALIERAAGALNWEISDETDDDDPM